MTKVTLNSQNRNASVAVPKGCKKLRFEVSRSNCNDVLLELVDVNGKAKGKPLGKYMPEIKTLNTVVELRFLMNNFSTSPITILIDIK